MSPKQLTECRQMLQFKGRWDEESTNTWSDLSSLCLLHMKSAYKNLAFNCINPAMHRCAPQQVAMLFPGNHIIVIVNKNEFFLFIDMFIKDFYYLCLHDTFTCSIGLIQVPKCLF